MHDIVVTDAAPRSPFFSQAIKAGQFVFVSGTVGLDTGTGQMAGPTIREQTRQALSNCEAILKQAGTSLADVVEVGVLLTRPEDFTGMNDEYMAWFPSTPPARYVARLGVEIPDLLVSIRMTAFVG